MPGVDMCDLPSPPPFSLYPPYPSSYFSSLHTRICILFLFFPLLSFLLHFFPHLSFSFFHLIFLYSISICYFSSNAHLLSSALHFHLCYPPHSLVFSSSMFPLSQLSFSRHLPHLLTCPPPPLLLSLFICSSFPPANIFPVFPSSMPSALSASSYPLCFILLSSLWC